MTIRTTLPIALCIVAAYAVPNPLTPCAFGEDAFQMLDQALSQDQMGSSEPSCEKARYSVALDRWFKAYLADNEAVMDKEWPSIVKSCTAAEDFRPLLRSINARLMLLEDVPPKKQSLIKLDTKLLVSTQKVLGPNHLLVASTADFLSDQLENAHDHKAALRYAKQVLAIREKNWGKTSTKLIGSLADVGRKALRAGSYDEALAAAERLEPLARRAKDGEALQQARYFILDARNKNSTRPRAR